MDQLKKTILGFACLLLLAVPLLYSAGFIIRQYQVRLAMKEQLATANLQTIAVHRNAVQWVDAEEARINGHLFDVYSKSEKEDSIWLSGLFDAEEDDLAEQLEKLVRKKNTQGPFSSFFKTFDLIFLKPETVTYKPVLMYAGTALSCRYRYLLQELSLPILLPPPKVC